MEQDLREQDFREQSSPKQGSRVQESKNQVLVVDDDLEICEIVSQMLERLGHEPVSVCSGASAVDEYQKGHYDLVLLDVAMPKMSGPEVYEQLRSDAVELPVVFMTGYRTEELADSLRDDAAVGFLAKPFPMDELRATVDSFLAASSRSELQKLALKAGAKS